MRHFNSPLSAARLAAAFTAVLFVLSACDQEPTAPHIEAAPEATAEAQGAASNMTASNAPFPTWQQSFQHDIAGWEYEGAAWCGSVERVEARQAGPASNAVSPSVGRAFAQIAHGLCDAPWDAAFAEGSGPASSAMPQGETFPEAGYVMDLDIYLDPDWDDGTAFGYSASFRVLDQEWPAHFRYYLHNVVADGGVVTVDGHPITQGGWYTFRHRFAGDDDGMLAVHFEVLKGGQAVFSEELPAVLEFAADGVHVHATNSFPVSNVSNAYLWFSYLTPELELPIDRQSMRPGQ